MLPKKQDLSHRSGFSLIEIIITLVVAGILGVMIYTLTYNYSLNSVESFLDIKHNLSVVKAMEEINSYYRSQIELGALDLNEFKNRIALLVKKIDPQIQVETKYILFDTNNQEISDTENAHRLLKVVLKKNKIKILNLFTK